MSTTNLDDVLSASQVPDAEAVEQEQVIEMQAPEDDNVPRETLELDSESETSQNDDVEENSKPEASEETQTQEVDDYGNDTEKPKMFSQEELNDRINKAVRERVSRLNRSEQQEPKQESVSQNQAQDNGGDGEVWQQQLESFVENTVNNLSNKTQQAQIQQQEQQAQNEFETKFNTGMGKFNDFVEVVSAQPITDAMTIASRGMKDPAAFFYAASKRNPTELERISKIPDQYAQMVEIGRLEERMRKAKVSTSAPKPTRKTPNDSSMNMTKDNKKYEPTLDDLLAQNDAQRNKDLRYARRR